MWHKQRAFRAARAELIAKAKARSGVAGWPGAICVVETPPSAELGAGNEVFPTGMIVDGQHRLGAAHVMASQGKLSGLLGQILVEVYPPMEEKAVRELFTEINRMEPVTLVDFPEEQVRGCMRKGGRWLGQRKMLAHPLSFCLLCAPMRIGFLRGPSPLSFQSGAGERREECIIAAAETLRERSLCSNYAATLPVPFFFQGRALSISKAVCASALTNLYAPVLFRAALAKRKSPSSQPQPRRYASAFHAPPCPSLCRAARPSMCQCTHVFHAALPLYLQGGAGEAEESIITAAAETLRERFPAMFKPSTNCRPPHLNVDVLRNEMHKAGLIQRLGLQSGEQLVSW